MGVLRHRYRSDGHFLPGVPLSKGNFRPMGRLSFRGVIAGRLPKLERFQARRVPWSAIEADIDAILPVGWESD